MLGKLRDFSKNKLSIVLVVVIIIPFVFWGMGSVFSGGNVNNIAKLNNETISTSDFVDFVNDSGLNPEYVKKNIDNNILEEILTEMISEKLIKMEIDKLGLVLTEENLAKIIKNNKNFLDKDNKFSRLKYEKFLIEQNISAPNFEINLKDRELRNNLFQYINGGIKSPYFLSNKIFINETKELYLDYFDLEVSYDLNITDTHIDEFINENLKALKEDFITFEYAKITPKDLLNADEFTNEFFKIIDDIENDILNENSLRNISKKYNINLVKKIDYKFNNEDEILEIIYNKRNEDRIQLIDKDDFFLLYEIEKINKILPKKTDEVFISKVKENIVFKRKYDFNQTLFKQIQNKELDENEFRNLAKDNENIKSIKINSINDIEMFDINSIKLLYDLPINSYALIGDNKNKIYLAKIKNIFNKNLQKDHEKVSDYQKKSNNNLVRDIYTSYDLTLNNQYKVRVFQNSIDRVKEYFK